MPGSFFPGGCPSMRIWAVTAQIRRYSHATQQPFYRTGVWLQDFFPQNVILISRRPPKRTALATLQEIVCLSQGSGPAGISSLDTGRAPQTTCHGVVWLRPAGCPDSAPAGGLSGRFIRNPAETPMISKLMPKIEVEGSHLQGGRLVVVTSGAFLTQYLCGSVLTETRRSVS